MKKRIENTDTIRDISKKTGISESMFRHPNGRKIRYDRKLPSLIENSNKK